MADLLPSRRWTLMSAALLLGCLDCLLVGRSGDGRIHLVAADVDDAAYPVVEFARVRDGGHFGLDDAVRALRCGRARTETRQSHSNSDGDDLIHRCPTYCFGHRALTQVAYRGPW